LFNKKESELSKPHTPKQPYSAPFREQMIELVRAGRKPGELAKEFGCHATSILNWVRQADQLTGVVPTQAGALSASERQELVELRRKLRQVQMERDILAKATAWFANNGDKTFTPSTR
jgi:transposase